MPLTVDASWIDEAGVEHAIPLGPLGSDLAGFESTRRIFYGAPQASIRSQLRGAAADMVAHVPYDAASSPLATRADVMTYTVQVQGQMRDGKRIVWMEGACAADRHSPDLDKTFIGVIDGGPCYFDAVFDPARDRFEFFRFNGPY